MKENISKIIDFFNITPPMQIIAGTLFQNNSENKTFKKSSTNDIKQPIPPDFLEEMNRIINKHSWY